MTFQRIISGLLILTIAGLAGAFYIDWRLATQLRTIKAFVEGQVFASSQFGQSGGLARGIREADLKRLPGLIKDLEFVTVEGGPHNIAWTHPEEVNSALLEFVGANVPGLVFGPAHTLGMRGLSCFSGRHTSGS